MATLNLVRRSGLLFRRGGCGCGSKNVAFREYDAGCPTLLQRPRRLGLHLRQFELQKIATIQYQSIGEGVRRRPQVAQVEADGLADRSQRAPPVERTKYGEGNLKGTLSPPGAKSYRQAHLCVQSRLLLREKLEPH